MRKLATLLLLGACGGVPPAGSTDAGARDAGGVVDAGQSADAGRGDAGQAFDAGQGTMDAGPTSCALRSTCDGTRPDAGAAAGFHSTTSTLLSKQSPRHRARDLFVKEGEPTWAIAKFSYATGILPEADLKDEDVEVWLLPSCGSGAPWQKVGTYRTSTTAGPGQFGVPDTQGRVYVDLTAEGIHLPVGRHRVHFVVKGDLTATDELIEVVAPNPALVVTDVDGTLTSSEYASWTDYIGGTPPEAHPGAADALTVLAQKGYLIFYLTARPEWLEPRTRDWLTLRGFPPGLVHTTLDGVGASGTAATTFKTTELNWVMAQTGRFPEYGFGNRDTDVAAYAAATILHTYYYDLPNVDLKGGTNHKDYGALASGFGSLPVVCK